MIRLKERPAAEGPVQNLPGSMVKELNRADRLLRDAGEKVWKEQRLGFLLRQYRDAIEETARVMSAWGVVKECSACAQEESGSCCFQGVEEWYDGILLFINLLMGCRIPRSREFPGHCLFLGESGCRLTARYAFCVNFLCPRLKGRLGEAGVAGFLGAAGRELGCGWELERALTQWLGEEGNLPGTREA